jgi:hypothetical protein
VLQLAGTDRSAAKDWQDRDCLMHTSPIAKAPYLSGSCGRSPLSQFSQTKSVPTDRKWTFRVFAISFALPDNAIHVYRVVQIAARKLAGLRRAAEAAE